MSIQFNSLARLHLTSICLILISGCAQTGGRGHVAKEWALSMRELQIVPVFPPREDVQIGDVYIVPVRPADEAQAFAEKGYLPRGMWIHTVKLNDLMSKFYEQRSDYPETGLLGPPHVVSDSGTSIEGIPEGGNSKAPGVDVVGKVPEARIPIRFGGPGYDLAVQPSTNRDVFKTGSNKRLRLVGFPSFMSATFTEGDLSSFIPMEAGGLAGTASFSKSSSVSINVPVAESCGLPANLVINALKREVEGNSFVGPDPDGKPFNPLDGIGDFVSEGNRTFVKDEAGEIIEEVVRIRIATEVFYARVVDVSMRAQEEQGGLLDWAMPDKTAQNASGDPEPANNARRNPGPPQRDGYLPEGQEKSAEQDAADLQKRLDAARRDVPGVSMRVVSVSKNAINMRRIYDRPVAIGFRGFDVDVYLDAKDGKGKFLRMVAVGVTESALGRDGGLKAKPKPKPSVPEAPDKPAVGTKPEEDPFSKFKDDESRK